MLLNRFVIVDPGQNAHSTGGNELIDGQLELGKNMTIGRCPCNRSIIAFPFQIPTAHADQIAFHRQVGMQITPIIFQFIAMLLPLHFLFAGNVGGRGAAANSLRFQCIQIQIAYFKFVHNSFEIRFHFDHKVF